MQAGQAGYRIAESAAKPTAAPRTPPSTPGGGVHGIARRTDRSIVTRYTGLPSLDQRGLCRSNHSPGKSCLRPPVQYVDSTRLEARPSWLLDPAAAQYRSPSRAKKALSLRTMRP